VCIGYRCAIWAKDVTIPLSTVVSGTATGVISDALIGERATRPVFETATSTVGTIDARQRSN
jgi:hypothetical protein